MAENFQTLRNLLYYPDNPNRLFFFNTLTYYTGHDNDEYISRAFHIAAEGYKYLTKNILTDPNGLLTQGSQKYMDKMATIKKFLELAIETEQKNELAYFHNMIITLKEKFNNLPMPDSVQQLINYFESVETKDVFDYDTYIYMVNNLLQGKQATEATLKYEIDRLDKLQNAYESSKREIAESIVGGANNFAALSKRAQNILEWRVGNELNARYLKQGSTSAGNSTKRLPTWDKIIDKYFKTVPVTADNKIAAFTNRLIRDLFMSNQLRQQILDDINQYMRNNSSITNLEQVIRSEIVLRLQEWGKQHTKELLESLANTNDPTIINIQNQVIQSLASVQGLYTFQIDNLPPGLAGTKELNFFTNSKLTKTGTRSGQQLYQAVRQFINKVDSIIAASRNLTTEQQAVLNSLQLQNNSANLTILHQIELLETLEQTILNRVNRCIQDQQEITLNITEIMNTLNINNSNSRNGRNNTPLPSTITFRVSSDGTIDLNSNNKILTRILKANGYITHSLTSSTLKNFISAMKGKASSMLKQTLQQNVISTGNQQLLDVFNRHLNTINVSVKGSMRAELMSGIEIIQKANGELALRFGGTQNDKNDFAVITIDPGVRELQQQFGIAYKEIVGRAYKSNLQPLYEEKVNAVKTFQESFIADIQDLKKQHIYHDYAQQAKSFFKHYDEHTQKMQQILKQYEQAGKEFAKIKKTVSTSAKKANKSDKEVKRILSELKKTLTQSIYRSDTTKTYDEYNNKIGFLGGSLGTNLETQLNSINILLEQGGMGLAPDEMNYLTDIIINTSYESIIGTKYQSVIERYLSAVAAFALFDEGGAEIEIIKHTLDKTSLKHSSPKILHLYRLDNLYYPGSYILKETLAGVMELGKVMTINTHGARIKIVNNTNLDIVPNNPWQPGEPINHFPWETVSAYALDHTELQITFLAGMLQILTNLRNRMSNITMPA